MLGDGVLQCDPISCLEDQTQFHDPSPLGQSEFSICVNTKTAFFSFTQDLHGFVTLLQVMIIFIACTIFKVKWDHYLTMFFNNFFNNILSHIVLHRAGRQSCFVPFQHLARFPLQQLQSCPAWWATARYAQQDQQLALPCGEAGLDWSYWCPWTMAPNWCARRSSPLGYFQFPLLSWHCQFSSSLSIVASQLSPKSPLDTLHGSHFSLVFLDLVICTHCK